MKRLYAIALALASVFVAHGAGELVATGADVHTWRIGDYGGGASFTNAALTVSRTICPWKISVTNAIKRTSSTEDLFTPTNYLVTCSITATNALPTWADFERTVTNVTLMTQGASTNLAYSTVTNVQTLSGSRLGVTNVVTTATVTNAVRSLAGLSSAWTPIATNGFTTTVTKYTATPAGGTITLKNCCGDTWTLDLTDGTATVTNVLDIAKLAFPGGLTATATDAERADIKIVYLTFAK